MHTITNTYRTNSLNKQKKASQNLTMQHSTVVVILLGGSSLPFVCVRLVWGHNALRYTVSAALNYAAQTELHIIDRIIESRA